MLEIIKALILGVVEGITEWLPVSSTGHLILADEFIQMGLGDDFTEMFNVVIQLGAILAVVVIFGKSFGRFATVPAWRVPRGKARLLILLTAFA